MKEIDLNGEWRLAGCAPGAGDAQGWAYAGVPADMAIPAQVPGDVHLDLLRAGRIEDPLFGKNSLDCRWIEARDWWYCRTFTVDESLLEEPGNVELHAAGLDLTAEIWLNGQHVGGHNNQFVPATFDVTSVVRPGENLLVVRLDVGLQAAPSDRRRYVHISSLPASGLPRMWMRKAQFCFGWDWAPRLLTCGIWRPITLRFQEQVAIRDVAIVSDLLPSGAARLRVKAELESFAGAARAAHVRMELAGDDTEVLDLDATLLPGVNPLSAEMIVPQPRLWWPRPLGEPYLYDFSLEVAARATAEALHSRGPSAGATTQKLHAAVLDRYETRVGIRQIELRQEPLPGDEGTGFTIVVNGEPVFCHGANWAPADSIPARLTPDRYAALIGAAAEANINMLRIWGGGIVEDPCFYRLCDEAGIMVWQDFLFACSLYPDDNAEFRGIIRREAEAIVRQLRNHACLVLWCGSNENDWITWRRVNAGWRLPTFYGREIYHKILPDVCARLDPTRPYWPSSPYGGDDPNSETSGDRHHWDVPLNLKDPAERLDFRRWGAERGKFISEFGMLAPPSVESLSRFLSPEEVAVGSPGWRFHNNLFEMDNLATSLRLYWGEPESLSLHEYVLATQMIQAEAMKVAVEHQRHRQRRALLGLQRLLGRHRLVGGRLLSAAQAVVLPRAAGAGAAAGVAAPEGERRGALADERHAAGPRLPPRVGGA
jgi:beta-mannosidase